ncbi:uncharacterized protein TNCV_4706031 [Trichonephila clavipes]|nr:uncharacterized protein TNCV_4706031 [Trichonephila clavipes]
MQILYGKYVSVHVWVGGASRKIGFISACNLRRISFAIKPRRISWCYFEAIASIQIATVKMSNHQRLDDGMKWRIVGRLEAGQYQVQICRDFTLTPSVVCNLWNSSRTLDPSRESLGKRWFKSHDGQGRSPFVDYSEA